MAVEISREIRRAVDTGLVQFGETQTEKSLRNGTAKLAVLSKNCKKETKEKIEHLSKVTGIPTLLFAGTGKELGAVCGKPFIISAMAIKETGKSNILKTVK